MELEDRKLRIEDAKMPHLLPLMKEQSLVAVLRRIRWKIYMSRVVPILWQRCRILPPPLLSVSDFSFVYRQSEISVNQIMRCT